MLVETKANPEISRVILRTNKNQKELQVLSAQSEIILNLLPPHHVKPRQHTKKQRHYFANKGLSSQGYGISSGHVWM